MLTLPHFYSDLVIMYVSDEIQGHEASSLQFYLGNFVVTSRHYSFEIITMM